MVKMFLFASAFLGPVGVLQSFGLTTLATLLVGAIQMVPARLRTSRWIAAPRIEMGPRGATVAIVMVVYRFWTAGGVS